MSWLDDGDESEEESEGGEEEWANRRYGGVFRMTNDAGPQL